MSTKQNKIKQEALHLQSVFGIETVLYVQMEDFMVQSYISKQWNSISFKTHIC